jgi:hypothetical protein
MMVADRVRLPVMSLTNHNNMTTTTEFTMEKALQVQHFQLCQWAKVLNADAYWMLVKEANRQNEKGYKSPCDVFRGVDIENFIHNWIMNEL